MNTEALSFEQGVAVGAGAAVCLFLVVLLIHPWLRAVFSGGGVPLGTVIGLRLRGNPVHMLVDAHLALLKGGEIFPFEGLEAAYMKHKGEIQGMNDLLRIVRNQYGNLIDNLEEKSNN